MIRATVNRSQVNQTVIVNTFHSLLPSIHIVAALALIIERKLSSVIVFPLSWQVGCGYGLKLLDEAQPGHAGLVRSADQNQ